MFGLTTFNQSSFNALGGTTYIVTTAETFTLSDAYTGPVAFGGIIADSISLSDLDTSQFNFAETIAEN